MIIQLSDYLASVSEISLDALLAKLSELVRAMSVSSPTYQNTIECEQYYDRYRCSAERMTKYKIQISILDKLFDKNPDVAPINKAKLIECLSLSDAKKSDKEQKAFFLLQHALIFSITKMGNCSARSAYASLLLFDIFKGSDIKVGVQSFKTKDHFIVCIGNDTRGWMVYDPLTNPEIVFDLSYYTTHITPCFAEYSRPKVPFRMVVTQGNYDQFLAQLEPARLYVETRLRAETPDRLMADFFFSIHLRSLGVTKPMLASEHRELCELVTAIPSDEHISPSEEFKAQT